MDNSDTAGIHPQMEAIYRLYSGIASNLDPETGAGGKLLFAGEPTAEILRTLRAANIAGAASLAASADASSLRLAMREGALDFVVANLDEALRILKNEIRKKQTVAVGVSQSSLAVARKMLERGVQPDLLAPGLPAAAERDAFVARGVRFVEPRPLPAGSSFAVLPVPPADQQSAAVFDASLLDSLAPEDHLNRRWVRLAPRYLPAAVRRFRSIVRLEPLLHS